jgi:type I restriction enzyme S subunit
MMANGWQTVPLSEFLTQRKEFFTIDDFTRYKRARVKLHGKGIVLRDEVDGAEVKTKDQQAARTGELLVAEIDAKVGGFGIVPPELNRAIVSSHYFLFEINEQKCLREWLDWCIVPV